MNTKKILLYFNTLKYLKPVQLYYRFYYFNKNMFFNKKHTKLFKKKPLPLEWNNFILSKNSYIENNIFKFLNITHQFNEKIDWSFSKYGKLWTYNLNYFDFINQQDITKKESLILIHSYIENELIIKDGKEPYPISLRSINWIKFLSINKIQSQKINQKLYNDYQILYNNLEYHILGNHLLENGFSLLFGAYYFNDNILFKKAYKILILELNEQILNDGAHFELSPMYHQIILHRILDCINLIKLNTEKDGQLLLFLIKKSELMLGWLQVVTYNNGEIPMVNDSTYGISHSSEQLFNYAKSLGLTWEKSELKESGYRKIKTKQYELFIDIGDIKSDYIPGHTHSDMFNFELQVDNDPFIVDTGISTYEKNSIRNKERSTSSHNTVKIGDIEQTEVWGGFRVAKRAKIIYLKENNESILSTHNGYKRMGVFHQRKFKYSDYKIEIVDTILGKSNFEKTASFHFHPKMKIKEIKKNQIRFKNHKTSITFEGNLKEIKTRQYDYCLGFNKTIKATKIVVALNKQLTTIITLH